MATIFELTGSEREQRIAELKQKMLAAYAKNKAAHGEDHGEAQAAVAVAEEEPEVVAVAEPVAAVVDAPAANGAAVAAPKAAPAPKPAPRPAAPKPAAKEEAMAPALTAADMTRREFMTYAWGATLGLLAVEGGLLSYFFMYPRFKAGEFGGKFFLSQSEVPASDAPPVGNAPGKFWLVTTEEGAPKAIYMVCTHLGCLYKWEPSNFRFECPCHGSKFSHDGFYIEGPAPRSLDYFDLTEENGQVVVDTGRKIIGGSSAESPARIQTA
ncbi:MAG: Rieske 2Fe-2S domain-containing protein [Caldilineaceae bacterium]|nr:Rieske 2Fe-2S domain-containing protein [Caldilineaceae bacterium]